MRASVLSVWVQHQDAQPEITGKLGSIIANVGPFFIHSLRHSTKLWVGLIRLSSSSVLDMPDDLLIPLTNIMVVNETGQQIRFGQANTDEEITLQPKHLSMYCLRTNKASQRLIKHRCL